MNILLKQRLVGAIVLISLAVIFIPMWFTGQSDKGEQKFKSSIPPDPVYEIKSPQISVPLPLPATTLEKVPLSEPQIKDDSQVSGESQNSQKKQPEDAVAEVQPPANDVQKPSQEIGLKNKPSKQTGAVKTDSAKTDVIKAATEKADGEKEKPVQVTPPPVAIVNKKPNDAELPAKLPVNKSTSAADTTTQPIKENTTTPIKTSTVTGWVVQVGSFSQKTNAEKLRDKLRKMGMASFVASGQSNGKTVYRVRVGPEIDRADAEKIQATIKSKTKLKGLVMKYP